MTNMDARIKQQYQGIANLPAHDKSLLASLFERDSVTGPLVGSRNDTSVFSNSSSCRPAALYTVGGRGRTDTGSEVFHLKDRICQLEVPGLGPQNPNNNYVLLDSMYFVATPTGGQTALLSVTIAQEMIAPPPDWLVKDLTGQVNRKEVDFTITVQSFGLDGNPKDTDYFWHCLVEVGVAMNLN